MSDLSIADFINNLIEINDKKDFEKLCSYFVDC